jgi:hypothetical protein
MHSIVFVGVKLTDEFTSLEEPMILTLPQTRFSLSTDPISSDVRGELLPKI